MPFLLQTVILGQGPNAEAMRVQAEQMRAQAEAMRAQANAMRDAMNAQRDAQRARGEVLIPPFTASRMSRRQDTFAFLGFAIAMGAAVVILMPLFRAWARRIERAPRPDELASGASAERLERIERAVEAMAIEVERISEGQRFTTKLLSERASFSLPLER